MRILPAAPNLNMNCNPQYQAPAAAAIDRRDCLRAVIGAVLTACILDFDQLLSWQEPDLEHWLRSLGAHAIGDAALLRRLGAGYLAAHPEERDRAYLTRVLSGRSLSGAQAIAAADACRSVCFGLRVAVHILRNW